MKHSAPSSPHQKKWKREFGSSEDQSACFFLLCKTVNRVSASKNNLIALALCSLTCCRQEVLHIKEDREMFASCSAYQHELFPFFPFLPY